MASITGYGPGLEFLNILVFVCFVFLNFDKTKVFLCLIDFDGTHCDGAKLNTGEQMPVTTAFLVKLHL